jgi:amidase
MAIDYPTASARALAAALAGREVSALELFEAAVARIEAMDGEINAVVVRDFERAREAARAADAALARGERAPLLGVPMTVKESFHVLGLPTTWGLAEFKGWTPPYEATGVARLKAAGAVILGKTNIPPYLADFQSENPVYGRTRNPLDLGRSPGGSSGGSAAALAAGYVPLEFGSDIGGSIRIPAHFCGVFGHKPTWGLIPPTGQAPPPFTEPGERPRLSVVGPLARTAGDLDLALSILAGPDGDDAKAYRLELPPPRATRPGQARLLVLDRHPLAEVDDEIVAVLHNAAERLERAGAKVVRASERLPDLAAAHGLYMQLLLTIMGRGGAPGFPPPPDAHVWLGGLDACVHVRRAWARLFEEVDAVLAPPLGMAAYVLGDERDIWTRTIAINGAETPFVAQLAWPAIATLPGLPSTCAPAGRTTTGLPVGVQIIGPHLEDRTTIALAGMLEELG